MFETAPRASVETHDSPVARRVTVGQGVARLAQDRHVHLEGHLGAHTTVAAFEDPRGLDVGPLGVGLEVDEDVHDLGGRGLDHDLPLGLFGHAAGDVTGEPPAG